MCYLVSHFPELQFGTLVLGQSYRAPALQAKMAATLQYLSGGRFILGIGAGWKEDEYWHTVIRIHRPQCARAN